MNWIELHTDSITSDDLSLLDMDNLICECARHNCKAVAITCKNSVQDYRIAEAQAKRKGIFLIYGITVDCLDRNDRYSVTLLAKNQVGRENIFHPAADVRRGRSAIRAAYNAPTVGRTQRRPPFRGQRPQRAACPGNSASAGRHIS